jgi:hypothetical protein
MLACVLFLLSIFSSFYCHIVIIICKRQKRNELADDGMPFRQRHSPSLRHCLLGRKSPARACPEKSYVHTKSG